MELDRRNRAVLLGRQLAWTKGRISHSGWRSVSQRREEFRLDPSGPPCILALDHIRLMDGQEFAVAGKYPEIIKLLAATQPGD